MSEDMMAIMGEPTGGGTAMETADSTTAAIVHATPSTSAANVTNLTPPHTQMTMSSQQPSAPPPNVENNNSVINIKVKHRRILTLIAHNVKLWTS